MHGKDYSHISIAHAVRLVAMVALATAMLVVPAWTQNAVPPTARQAAAMPAFAHRLNPPATRQSAHRFPASAHARNHRGWPLDETVYENGPVNGQIDAWTINFGFTATDSIQVNSTVSGVQFWAWLIPGDTITNVEVQVGANAFGNELFDGVVNLTQSNCFSNYFGYNVCLESGNFTGPALSGNAWITLANASVPSGDPVYWDENSGIGCHSPGCPSQAQEDTVGTIPSEAFTLTGMTTTTVPPPPPCFESEGNLQVIHDFTTQEGGEFGGNGVAIDQAGNLYGTTAYGGDNEAGFAFKLARWAGWVLDPLYSFPTDNNGGYLPTGVIVGPNGSLYGGAWSSSGLVFNLTPPPKACGSALCGWIEGVPYRFRGGNDGWGTINISVFDREGNLYGTSSSGGAFGFGTVFKLAPSGGGWTESILYSFTGGSDASAPSQVLVGNDGNLYGVAAGGAHGAGVVFQLTPSGDDWIESILHTFQDGVDGYNPSYLVQDSAGNLYGIAVMYSLAPIFMLSKSGNGWVFSEYSFTYDAYLNNLAIDAAGNLYVTGGTDQGCGGGGCNGRLDSDQMYNFNFIFKAWHSSNGWQHQQLHYFEYETFPASGALALDAQGNLYGTTSGCGAYWAGTVWQLSP